MADDSNKRPGVLVQHPFPGNLEAGLEKLYRLHRPYDAPDKDAFIAAVAPDVRAIATGGAVGASRSLMERLPALEIVAIQGIGTDAVDLEYARSRRIRVTITPEVLTDDVADMAIGLMLAVSRRMAEGDRFVRAGKWLVGALPLAHKVSGKRLGIFGLGRIGRAVAKRAAAFDMAIAYTDRAPMPNAAFRFVPDLVGLARESDFLVVTASATPETIGKVNRGVLDALGPKGVLINVARGSLVDEAALVSALVAGRLGGAGLDVFADEPHVPEVLFRLDRVVLQPHCASSTEETRGAMADLVLANLAAHFAGRPLPSAAV